MRAILLAILLVAAPLYAMACQTLPPDEQRELDRLDTERHRNLVLETASDADLIVMARVVSISTNRDTATFLATRSIKGKSAGEFSLTLDQAIRIGCYPSSFFFSVNLELGGSYILYAKGGKVLRAGSNELSFGDITLREELRLIHKQLRPNNSFKQKPLRGSA